MGLPEISVIIPVYNTEKYLKEALDAVLDQTFQNFEVILVNDGSSDNSLDIINEYCKRYPRKIKCLHQSNQGQSAARNNGLSLATGKYIAFLDSDDSITDDYLESLYYAAESSNAQIAYCSYRAYDEKTGKTVYDRITENWTINFDESHLHVFQYSPYCKLIRKDYIDEYGFRFGLGEQMEDGPYCMMVDLLADRRAVVKGIKYYYRKRSDSTTGRNKDKRCHPTPPYNCLIEAVEKVRKNTDDEMILQMLEYCSVKIMTGWLTNIFAYADNDSRMKLCEYCKRHTQEWFPNICNNRLITTFKPSQIPLVHRCAVFLYLIAYRVDKLYLFSSVSAFFLRIVK